MAGGIFSPLILFVLFYVIASGDSLECYYCHSTTDYACDKGLPSLQVKQCRSNEMCVTHLYDVYADGAKVASGAARGCEKNHNYCADAKSLLKAVMKKTARVEDRDCYMCDSYLCNPAKKFSSSLFLITTLLFFSNASF